MFEKFQHIIIDCLSRLHAISLNKAFSDNPKAKAYFKGHKDVEINESYLLDLVNFLNEN